MQAARDQQKSYADLKRKPMEFQVEDKVMLKVSPWKWVHNTFHVSNLKKCYADEPLVVPLDGLHFDDKLQFVEEPVEIVDHEVKRLRKACLYQFSRFDGLQEGLSSHGNAKINSRRNTHTSSRRSHRRQVPYRKP
ncbi:hypothetical protein Tco_0149838 [Tanacetum coccineum]